MKLKITKRYLHGAAEKPYRVTVTIVPDSDDATLFTAHPFPLEFTMGEDRTFKWLRNNGTVEEFQNVREANEFIGKVKKLFNDVTEYLREAKAFNGEEIIDPNSDSI